VDAGELEELAGLWRTRMRNDGKAPNTIKSYRSAINAYLAWPGARDLTRGDVEAFTAAALDAGASPTTAELRCTALKGFSSFLFEEAATATDQLAGLRNPKRDERVVNGLSATQVAALIDACKGTSFADRRDTAIVRLMHSAGIRASELISMTMPRLDMHKGETVVQGKGSRERRVPIGGRPAESLAWYLRARRSHRLAGTPAVWLGSQGRTFAYSGMFKALKARAETAGIEHFHPHRLRHSFAQEWLRRGGSVSGLQMVAGWKSIEMAQRYVEDVAAELAIEEARRLGIGE
jgi:integrase/recombinase XerD